MFILSPTKPVDMGLQKMTVDLLYMSEDPEKNHMSTEQRLLKNTSGERVGIREKMINRLIPILLRTNPKIKNDAEEVYARLIEKANSASDYDPDQTMALQNYAIQLWFFLKKELAQEAFSAENDDNHEQFVSEDDKRGNEDIKVSTEDMLFRQGHFAKIEDRMTDEEARQTLVETLSLIKVYQDALMTTKDNHINALRVIQARIAYDHFYSEQLRLASDPTGKTDSQVIRVKQSKELIVSYGGMSTSNIKNVLKKNLAENFVSDKEKKGFYKALMTFLIVCDHLEIPIIELDVDEIMTDEYIKELYLILKHKETVCVSEYDLEEFEGNLTAVDLKESYIKDELVKDGVPSNRINHYFNSEIMSKIYRVKISDLRKLDNIVETVKHSHNTYIEESKFAGLKEREKNTADIKAESVEHKERLRRSRTSLLFGYTSTKEDNPGKTTVYTGPFSPEPLEIIMQTTNEYFTQMLINDPKRVREYYDIIWEKVIKPNDLTSDGNGFLKYKNGMYFQVQMDAFYERNNDKSKKFVFNKWLVNSKGFFVSKFLDAEIEVGEYMKVYRPTVSGYNHLIIKDIKGNIILNGYKG